MLGRFALELAVFTCGALVMVYEIIGSRIVSPFIGTSTYVWTSLIGVILAALSLGYWLGGRMADRRPDVKVLASAIFLAGGAVSLTILVKDAILSMISAAGGPLELKAVAAAALLFAPASVLLGFVTPYAVKLRTLSLEDSGKTVGRLYALSTIGSIAGTFAAGFLLIPFLGSTRTLYLIAAMLFVVSLMLAPFAFGRSSFIALVLFVLGVAGSEFSTNYMRTVHGLIDTDTEYSRIQVFRSKDAETGREFQAIATDPFFAQSAMYVDDGSPVFDYIPFYSLIRHYKPDHSYSLMIGGAGYTLPREYLKTYPDARMDVVEIDPQMTEIAREYFHLKDDPRMRIFHEDGRVFLNRAEAGQYDAVMIDAFGSLFSIPFQLTTVEAVGHVSRVLKPDGIVIVNIGSAFTGEAGQFLQAEYNTYKAVFPDVLLFKVRLDRADGDLQNAVLIACKSGCRTAGSSDPEMDKLFAHVYRNEGWFYNNPVPVLTDDLAPVEYYNSLALRAVRR